MRQLLCQAFERRAAVVHVEVDVEETHLAGVGQGGSQGGVEIAFRADLVAAAAAEDFRQPVIVPRLDVVELVVAELEHAARCRSPCCPAR